MLGMLVVANKRGSASYRHTFVKDWLHYRS
jgi:hypothetical protein